MTGLDSKKQPTMESQISDSYYTHIYQTENGNSTLMKGINVVYSHTHTDVPLHLVFSLSRSSLPRSTEFSGLSAQERGSIINEVRTYITLKRKQIASSSESTEK